MNNKGYVFTPLIVFLLVITTLFFIYFKQELLGSVNQASQVLGSMDQVHYSHSKLIESRINDFKIVVYQNLSNSSLVSDFNDSLLGILISNNPVIPLELKSNSYSKQGLNITYPLRTIPVPINYPLKDLLIAEKLFDPITLQQCIDDNGCSDNKQNFEEIIIDCIGSLTLNTFNLRNSSVPLLIGNQIYTDLELCKDGITVLFPFKIGTYSFFC